MPNKHKLAKLRTKLIASGKLKTNKDVKETMKHLQKKAQIDNEDIDYEFERAAGKNFEKLEESERNNRKVQKLNKDKPFGFNINNNKKRKALPDQQTEKNSVPKKLKQNDLPTQLIEPAVLESLPKKSKKNKYFLMAHPELIKTKEKLSNAENFGVEVDKIKLNELKKLKKKISNKIIPSKIKANEKTKNEKN